MREIRQSGSEGGEPQPNAASLPLSWRCCDLFWRPPLRSYHRQMVDDFPERSFVALHRLGGGGYLALLRLVLATTFS